MKKWIWIGITLAFIGGAFPVGRMIWRARYDLVSLDVSNAPLDEVVRIMRRQTHENILADTNLHARISLHLSNVPLPEALKRLAAQARALAGTVHAIYFTARSLESLQDAFVHGRSIEKVGWTNLAPILDLPMPSPHVVPLDGPLASDPLPPGAMRMTEDVQVAGPGAPPGGSLVVRDGKHAGGPPMMVMRFQKSDGTGKTEVEIWSPERIVAQSDLVQRLSGAFPVSPSRAEAEATAARLKAHCQTFFALKRSPGGMDTLMHAPEGMAHHTGASDDGKGPSPVPGDGVEAMIRREKLAQYQDLTPQQRVERMRELKSNKDVNK